jgi:hypothetical protein
MSWIDRILVQIGAILKKHHGNHTQNRALCGFYGQNTSKYGTVWTLQHPVEAMLSAMKAFESVGWGFRSPGLTV